MVHGFININGPMKEDIKALGIKIYLPNTAGPVQEKLIRIGTKEKAICFFLDIWELFMYKGRVEAIEGAHRENVH